MVTWFLEYDVLGRLPVPGLKMGLNGLRLPDAGYPSGMHGRVVLHIGVLSREKDTVVDRSAELEDIERRRCEFLRLVVAVCGMGESAGYCGVDTFGRDIHV